MGVASYNRGSAHLSAQIDRDLREKAQDGERARIARETVELEFLADWYSVAFRKLRDAGNEAGYLALKLHGLDVRRRAVKARRICVMLNLELPPCTGEQLKAFYAAGGRRRFPTRPEIRSLPC